MLDDPEQMGIRIARNAIDDLRNRRIELGTHWADSLQQPAVAVRAVLLIEAGAGPQVLCIRLHRVVLLGRVSIDVLVHRHVRQPALDRTGRIVGPDRELAEVKILIGPSENDNHRLAAHR